MEGTWDNKKDPGDDGTYEDAKADTSAVNPSPAAIVNSSLARDVDAFTTDLSGLVFTVIRDLEREKIEVKENVVMSGIPPFLEEQQTPMMPVHMCRVSDPKRGCLGSLLRCLPQHTNCTDAKTAAIFCHTHYRYGPRDFYDLFSMCKDLTIYLISFDLTENCDQAGFFIDINTSPITVQCKWTGDYLNIPKIQDWIYTCGSMEIDDIVMESDILTGEGYPQVVYKLTCKSMENSYFREPDITLVRTGGATELTTTGEERKSVSGKGATIPRRRIIHGKPDSNAAVD